MREGIKRTEIRVPEEVHAAFVAKCGELGLDMNPSIVALMRSVNAGRVVLSAPAAITVTIAAPSGELLASHDAPPNARTKRRTLIESGRRHRRSS